MSGDIKEAVFTARRCLLDLLVRGLCQAYFSSFPPKLFVRLFIILVQRGMNT